MTRSGLFATLRLEKETQHEKVEDEQPSISDGRVAKARSNSRLKLQIHASICLPLRQYFLLYLPLLFIFHAQVIQDYVNS